MKKLVWTYFWYIAILIACSVNAYTNQTNIKNGERLFLSYCNGCHSLKYTDYPVVSMPNLEAQHWFGIVPPDLTLISKYRGKEWLKEYLHSFYSDKSRPFNCNNKLMPNVQMPNVLYPIANSKSYTQDIEDIVEFLTFVADPTVEERYRLGIFVELFLIILIFMMIRRVI